MDPAIDGMREILISGQLCRPQNLLRFDRLLELIDLKKSILDELKKVSVS